MFRINIDFNSNWKTIRVSCKMKICPYFWLGAFIKIFFCSFVEEGNSFSFSLP